MMSKLLTTLCAVVFNLVVVSAVRLPPTSHAKAIEGRQITSGPMVFAHYMLVFQPSNNDYTNDITLAKAAGIDAFAVNFERPGWAY